MHRNFRKQTFKGRLHNIIIMVDNLLKFSCCLLNTFHFGTNINKILELEKENKDFSKRPVKPCEVNTLKVKTCRS